MLEFVGVFCITAVLLLVTWWFISLLYMQAGFGGWDGVSKSGWVIIASLSIVLIVSWLSWWQFIGSHIHISMS